MHLPDEWSYRGRTAHCIVLHCRTREQVRVATHAGGRGLRRKPQGARTWALEWRSPKRARLPKRRSSSGAPVSASGLSKCSPTEHSTWGVGKKYLWGAELQERLCGRLKSAQGWAPLQHPETGDGPSRCDQSFVNGLPMDVSTQTCHCRLPSQPQPSKSGHHRAMHRMQQAPTEFRMWVRQVLPGGTQHRADS